MLHVNLHYMYMYVKAVGNKGTIGGEIHFPAVFRAAAQNSELSGGPTPNRDGASRIPVRAYPWNLMLFGGGADL